MVKYEEINTKYKNVWLIQMIYEFENVSNPKMLDRWSIQMIYEFENVKIYGLFQSWSKVYDLFCENIGDIYGLMDLGFESLFWVPP